METQRILIKDVIYISIVAAFLSIFIMAIGISNYNQGALTPLLLIGVGGAAAATSMYIAQKTKDHNDRTK